MSGARVLIVGGGPVGLAAAVFAHQAGLTPVIVEAGASDGDKACGEGLMPGVAPLLAELGIDPPGHELVGVSYSHGNTHVEHLFPDSSGRGVRRTALVDALRTRADQCGVERIRARVTGVDQDRQGVRLVCADAADQHADYVLACDGLHSTIAAELGLVRPPAKNSRRYGLRQHFYRAPWSSMIEVHYAGDTELYITPVATDTVGVAVLGPKGLSLQETIAQVPAVAKRLAGATPASSLRGAGPFPHRVKKARVGRVLLVGDAAGYVDAITGEGLRVGFAQAKEAVASIRSGSPESYPGRWRAVTREFRVLTRGLVVLASSPLRGRIVPLAHRFPGLFGAVVNRLAS
ncbi:Dehydrogenase (flavoprotein) MenJ [Pontimonas salivibrio]|uniref:Dehydrogenase (Flavoprotein) MenJ n=1 Tax=Pontimonas salivibrio TaxID=1159327 RepID=A0A2L2BP44_9MICO|nr:NAD(P)/FAD-dependent oxidoreductase [Pontimonas salivibrio]AVG23446.1 Dehydrogenase (flavoprotein) MenJ [Pontimonas salivibrio]